MVRHIFQNGVRVLFSDERCLAGERRGKRNLISGEGCLTGVGYVRDSAFLRQDPSRRRKMSKPEHLNAKKQAETLIS